LIVRVLGFKVVKVSVLDALQRLTLKPLGL